MGEEDDMKKRQVWLPAVFAVGLGAALGYAAAGGRSGAAGREAGPDKPDADASAPRIVLPPPATPIRAKVGTTYRDSKPGKIPGPPRAPAGAANVVIVLLDDVGFGA